MGENDGIESTRDLWWVEVLTVFRNTQDELRRFILSTPDPVTAREAARLACVKRRRNQGLPNGEYPAEFHGTAFEKWDGERQEVATHVYSHAGGGSFYRCVDDGSDMEWEAEGVEALMYDWHHDLWHGKL